MEMDESFNLPVKYKDNEIEFPAQFLRTGYSYKIQVDVYGTVIDFEPDEERNWRALLQEQQDTNQKITTGLLQSIANSLEEITK